ncbi:MAG: hypothetical protein ACR2NF_11045 [Pirellulales bacterium]
MAIQSAARVALIASVQKTLVAQVLVAQVLVVQRKAVHLLAEPSLTRLVESHAFVFSGGVGNDSTNSRQLDEHCFNRRCGGNPVSSSN